MTYDIIITKKYVADEGKVFDWATPHYHTEEVEGEEVKVQDHLYAKSIFLSETDDIENYIEVVKPEEDV